MSRIYKNKKELTESLVQKNDMVLDVGFWGQAVKRENPNWVHGLLKNQAKDVYGVDISYGEDEVKPKDHYRKASAENFDFGVQFDVIFAGDLIEHLSNPGLFLDSCARNLRKDGRLIITTPNCFNLYNVAEKFIKSEPEVNSDHTFYFNRTVLEKLLEKNGWQPESFAYLDDAEDKYTQSFKRRVLYFLYKLFSLFTPKFTETLVIVAKR